jgi:hypothetical protein
VANLGERAPLSSTRTMFSTTDHVAGKEILELFGTVEKKPVGGDKNYMTYCRHSRRDPFIDDYGYQSAAAETMPFSIWLSYS